MLLYNKWSRCGQEGVGGLGPTADIWDAFPCWDRPGLFQEDRPGLPLRDGVASEC